MTPARLRWGLLFVAIGVAILLTNADVLGGDYWVELVSLWPLILISIGLEKIFLHTSFRFLSYIAPFILIAGMVYAGIVSESDSYRDDSFWSRRWSEDIGDSVKKIEANIDHRQVDISIGQSHTGKMRANFDRFGRRPSVEYVVSDTIGKLDIGYRGGGLGTVVVINSRHKYNDWDISFADNVPLSLKCRGENSDVNLNMETIPLDKVSVDDEEGNIYLKIGELVPAVDINIAGENAAFRLRAPQNCGLKVKVRGDNYINYLESLDLTEQDDYFISNNFDSAGVKLSVEIDDDLRSLSINYY